MHKQSSMTMLAAAIAAVAMLGAGCSDQKAPGTVGQRIDNTTDKMAATTDRATAKAATAIDDSALTAKVKTAMMADPSLKALQINVDTKDGTVTLNGPVESQAQKQHATEVAQGVSGVKSVDNNLTVKTTG